MSDSLLTDDRGPLIIAISVVIIILSTLAVTFRFWSRMISKAGLWWDDWTILLALVSSFLIDDIDWIQKSDYFVYKPFEIEVCAISIYWVSIGFGKYIHQAKEPITFIYLVIFCENFLYNTGLTLVKVSVLLFYSRVFKGDQWFNIALWIAGALVFSWWITTNFRALFTCIPVAKAWDSTISGHCINTYQTYLATAILNVLTDFILLILPLPLLWKLQTTKDRKVVLSLVFVMSYWWVRKKPFKSVLK